MVTLESFKALYPAFAAAGDAWIQALIDQVETVITDTLVGDYRDEVVGLEVASRLARSPIGRKAQLVAKDGSSAFSRRLDEVRREHACAFMRVQ